MDPLGTLLGPSWASLGRLLASLWRSLGLLGCLLAASDAAKNRQKMFFFSSWRFWAALDPVLAPLGLIFVPPGQHFGVFLASPGAVGQCFGVSTALPGRFPPTFLAKLLHQVSRNVRGNLYWPSGIDLP